jgi:Uma2 family endonuclease
MYVATAVVFEDRVVVPLGLASLADFRRWALSEEFPEQGRIDYIGGVIEVDMSPEEVVAHGRLKNTLNATLFGLVEPPGLGLLLTDRSRVSSVPGDLSAEPDIVFVSYEALAEGRVRMIEKAGGEPDRYIELEGAPDLIVEVVSDSSVRKDTKRLPRAYFLAGVREFWLADARREPFLFRIHHRAAQGFEAVVPDADGFQPSPVFACRFRLDWHRDRSGYWAFDLRRKEDPRAD